MKPQKELLSVDEVRVQIFEALKQRSNRENNKKKEEA